MRRLPGWLRRALRPGLPSGSFPLHWASLRSPESSCRAAGLLPSLSSRHCCLITLSCHTCSATHRRCLAWAERQRQPPSLPNDGLPPQAGRAGRSRRALGSTAPVLSPAQHCLCPPSLPLRGLRGLEIPSQQKHGVWGSLQDNLAPSPGSPVSSSRLQTRSLLGSTTSPRGARLMGNILCTWQSAEAICLAGRGG